MGKKTAGCRRPKQSLICIPDERDGTHVHFRHADEEMALVAEELGA